MRLLAQGRDADVFVLDDTRVLRRYRDRTHSNTQTEARVMEYLAAQGYPVPKVHDLTDIDLVMERLHGPTLMQAWERRPWRLAHYARQLADLHDRLAAVPAPDWLLAPRTLRDREPGGTGSVLHLDLHPLNVILTPDRGPVVFDWTNAAAGDPAFDLARTIVTIATADLPLTRPSPPAPGSSAPYATPAPPTQAPAWPTPPAPNSPTPTTPTPKPPACAQSSPAPNDAASGRRSPVARSESGLEVGAGVGQALLVLRRIVDPGHLAGRDTPREIPGLRRPTPAEHRFQGPCHLVV